MTKTYGVSPAYFISRFGTAFTVDDILTSCSDLGRIGFSSVQLEVFEEASLASWTREKVLCLADTLDENQLKPSQFVAHFLMNWLTLEEFITSKKNPNRLLEVVEAISFLKQVSHLTVPAGTFSPASSSPLNREDLQPYFIDKLRWMTEKVGEAGLTFNVEILPGSLIEGSTGLLELTREEGLEGLGLCFDTGHHHVRGERLEEIPGRMGPLLRTTHLCDNDGVRNRSLSPGEGTIEWEPLLKALDNAGYEGSLDLEIICESSAVNDVYREGLCRIKDRKPRS